MIRAIIFDCFGVLSLQNTWQTFLDGLPPEVDEDALHELNHRYDSGELTRDAFITAIKQQTGRVPVEVEQLPPGHNGKNRELLTYIKTLKPTFKLGVLSNIASSWITDQLLDSEEQALFDDMVLSYQVGMTKPNPVVYHLVCQRLGVDETETIMIDDIATYIEAAERVGMHGIVYESPRQVQRDIERLVKQLS